MSQNEGKSALTRRTFVGRLAAGAAGAAVTVAGVGSAKALSTIGATSPAGTPSENAPGLVPQAPQADPAMQAVAPSIKETGTPPPWELFRPLAEGSSLGHGWRVAGLTGVSDGSCVLTLENERGRSHRVHVCRNDGQPQGLVYTERLDLVVMNGGLGDLPTEEGLAQAVAAVAHALAANESATAHREVMAALLPQAERVQRFAAAATLR